MKITSNLSTYEFQKEKYIEHGILIPYKIVFSDYDLHSLFFKQYFAAVNVYIYIHTYTEIFVRGRNKFVQVQSPGKNAKKKSCGFEDVNFVIHENFTFSSADITCKALIIIYFEQCSFNNMFSLLLNEVQSDSKFYSSYH